MSTFEVCLLDNVIPFVLLQDDIIRLKPEFQQDWNKFIKGEYILQTSELEVELIACALCAVELLLQKLPQDINIAQLTYYLRTEGKRLEYVKYSTFHTRGSLSNCNMDPAIH
eukprot:TRINITY_DN4846_c0_g1_i1.p1 TRINITY_DN4846_c0_g1~~TRINITY_DN4846_c0_g1_i1.p1  ORF type:complete len:112 (+),score=20.91 TRINITY_DN4846_c0_g1_i1:287-622(+)